MFTFIEKIWLVLSPQWSMEPRRHPKPSPSGFGVVDPETHIYAAGLLGYQWWCGEINRFQYTWQAFKVLFIRWSATKEKYKTRCGLPEMLKLRATASQIYLERERLGKPKLHAMEIEWLAKKAIHEEENPADRNPIIRFLDWLLPEAKIPFERSQEYGQVLVDKMNEIYRDRKRRGESQLSDRELEELAKAALRQEKD